MRGPTPWVIAIMSFSCLIIAASGLALTNTASTLGRAIQSRYSGRRTDFAPTLSAARSEEAIAGAPAVTLYTSEGHLRPLEEIEADIIRLAIGHYRGRMTEVARRLGIGRSTLYRKLGDLGIDTAA